MTIKRLKKTKYNNSKQGFTLIEIIVALAVLSIMMVAFLTLFAASFNINTKVDNDSKAFYLAESYMEEVYSKSQAVSHTDTASQLGFAADGSEYKKNEDGFEIKLKFSESDSESDLYNVLIRVYDNSDSPNPLAQIEDIMPFQ